MAKQNIKTLTQEILCDFLKENGMELYNVEFKKHGKDWFLSVYIDKAEGSEEEYIGTEDCELVSRYLSEKMDELDPIDQNYYLEVSSPGMDRTLFEKKHFERFKGKDVEIKLYNAINGQKNYQGIIRGIDEEDNVIIENEKGEEIKLPFDKISKAKLAVVF